MNQNKNIQKDEVTGDVLLSGHEYDGIRELDNKLPKWWLWLFILTIVYSVIYIFVFDVIKVAPYQEEEYTKEMASAGVQPGQPSNDQFATMVALSDQPSLDAGRQIWMAQCKVCHLEGGQGLVGPNLTDNFAIHGCGYGDVVKIITIGVPEKGMIAWKAQLSEKQIQEVASYTMTLKGTNPPNPKPAQGDTCR